MLEMVPDIAQSTHDIRNIFADIRNVPTILGMFLLAFSVTTTIAIIASEAPIAQPVYYISTKQEYALCYLLNISPSQISYLTLHCNASAPSGSKISEDPCHSEYITCNSNGEITSIVNIPI